MDIDLPKHPYDLEELKFIERLLSKIPLYKEKIEVLHKSIKELSKAASNAGSFSNAQELDNLICKAFFSELENRPFDSCYSNSIARLKAEIAWGGIIKNRNIPCEICGENRSIDKCHIIPDKLGGLKEDSNLLYLCPTHHRLFDRFMLSKPEWAAIDWSRKSEHSQAYVLTVTFEAHKKFWAKLDAYENIGQYGADEKPFVLHVANQIGKLFLTEKLINRTSIYKLIDKQIREISKKVLSELIKHGVIAQFKIGTVNKLTLTSVPFHVPDEIVFKIWQEIL